MVADSSFAPAAMNCSHRYYPLEEFFSSARANGYEAVELWLGPMHFFVDHRGTEDPQTLLGLAEKYGLRIVGICPEQNNPKPSNVAARGRGAQDRSFAYFKNVIDLGVTLGCVEVSLTPGWGFLSEPREAALERSAIMLRRLCDYSDAVGMRLAVEALQPEESCVANSARQLKELIDAVDRPTLGVNLDTGAMWRAGETAQDYFDAFGPRVIHCHFVDAGIVSHVAWGDGLREMARDLRSLVRNKYSGYLSMEVLGERYLASPAAADAQCMHAYRQCMEEIGL
ncbi:sugar phosphate isomerase/epimerase [Olsenella sp. Marseille-P4559]|jgi:protein FrlC|uniref:sugar phosphate isomerase/epimerase family protein n=1 Tax=Olsenella sp. Marseille-P4559 TaxID=2364795 RepID=UPI00102F7D5D|nr:sugar phosphate isomerase/epimerase family protein [Olsenella sp. Marseille-P4559]